MISHSRPYITKDDITTVLTILQSENIAKGEAVSKFETALRKFLGAKSVFTTCSGTTSLILGLKALGIKYNDEIILPTYVCRNVMNAVSYVGAIPVLCDIGNEWNMTTDTVKKKISKKTKAIIVVHIYGIPADCKAIKELGFPVIEDCCQSFGASINGKKMGSESEFSMYSFHATKLLTTGEGGALATNNLEIISNINETSVNAQVGQMTNIQAALGLTQLKKYNQMLDLRRKIADKYFNEINAVKVKLSLTIRDKSIFFRFPLTIDGLDFERVKNTYSEHGIHVRHGVQCSSSQRNGNE